MERTRSMPQLMSIESMYKLTKRENAVWGVEGYEVPKFYVDAAKNQKEEAYKKQKKGQKSTQHVTKKGHFLDDIAKETKGVPGPQKYIVFCQWVNPKDKDKPRPKSAPQDRGSFIDEIFKNEKKRPTPGIGTYNVTETLKQQKVKSDDLGKKKIAYGVKPCFLSDYELLGDTLPGPGNYNAREILPKLKQNTTKPEQWIKKHKEINEKSKKSTLPAVGSYKHHPSDYQTFGKQLELLELKGKPEAKSIQYWGKEQRFTNSKTKSLSKMTMIVPAPNRYEMMAHWPGKNQSTTKKDEVKMHWMNRVTKGVQLSIYH